MSEQKASGGQSTSGHPATTLPPRWDLCDIPQAFLAALKLREGKKSNG